MVILAQVPLEALLETVECIVALGNVVHGLLSTVHESTHLLFIKYFRVCLHRHATHTSQDQQEPRHSTQKRVETWPTNQSNMHAELPLAAPAAAAAAAAAWPVVRRPHRIGRPCTPAYCTGRCPLTRFMRFGVLERNQQIQPAFSFMLQPTSTEDSLHV